MFRVTLKLPVETPEQPFIEAGNLKFIQPFLKIIGYQGLVDKKFEFVSKRLKRNIIQSKMILRWTPNPIDDVVQKKKGKQAAGETS
uniref:Uncharacterized protein n=1 Tax=Tanacetum cinerariifolium TaxID=118510 RepID=A0A6L2J2F3_TANCI|nr:hypothetical protein [Tanacetum cinerariifolium]